MKNLKISAGALILATAACVAWHTFGNKPGHDAMRERHAVHVSTGNGGTRSVPQAEENAVGPLAAVPQPGREEIMQKLEDAAVTYDPAQLPVIRPYLVDADPAVRTAAVNAMVVLGDAAAAPMLRDAAKQLNSPDEATVYERKADYLELPPVSSEELASKLAPPATK